MDINYGVNLEQSQKLMMTAKLMQSLKILNMSSIELENEIKKEGEQNPVIELDDSNNERKIDWNEYIKSMQKSNYRDKNEFAYNVDNEVDFENMINSSQNLYEFLKSQIRYYKMTKEENKICEYIIDSLDENGYLMIQDKLDIKEKLSIDEEKYEKCLKYVQALEPNGVGGSSLEECLLIQVRNLEIKDEILEQIIREDLKNIGNKNIREICKKYGIKQDECMNYINIIRGLEPKPGKIYQKEDIQYIKPDVIIRKMADDFIVISNNKYDMNIYISNVYQNILSDDSDDVEAKIFIKERLNNALSLIKNIENRKSTILKIANAILKRQREFFEKGLNYIKPLKMQEIADELDLHLSTISRGVNGKYMLTPYGLFEFKYFFSQGLETQGTESISNASIKKIIKDKIKNEDKSKPLSDEKIKEMLNQEGIVVARRTVAKYREELGILPSSKRKSIKTK